MAPVESSQLAAHRLDQVQKHLAGPLANTVRSSNVYIVSAARTPTAKVRAARNIRL
jgi:hypothetical protein